MCSRIINQKDFWENYSIKMKGDITMAIKCSSDNSNIIDVAATPEETTTVEDTKISLAKVEEVRDNSYMIELREKVRAEISANGRMDQLTSLIDLENNNTILEYGKEPAEYMAGIADSVLSQYNTANVDGTAKLVDSLMRIMNKIDIQEIKTLDELVEQRKKKSIFGRFKESAQQKLDKLVAKYKGIGDEMEVICSQLRTYEENIKNSNTNIDKMYDGAMEEYRVLQEYIVAGEDALRQIEEYKKNLEANSDGSQESIFQIQNVGHQINLMEKRLLDLRTSETIALQAIPTYKIQEYTNANLARKINSAFVVTVPAFKTALVTAVITKQQALTAQGLAILDEATAQFIKQSAQNTVDQLHNSQQLMNKPMMSADDIEQVWGIIMNGITEYRTMEDQYRDIMKEESKRIDAANSAYIKKLKDGGAV